MNTDKNDPIYHLVRHKFKDEIIIPYVALRGNVDFFHEDNSHLLFIDGNKGKVLDYKEIHVCDAEDEIMRIYGMDAWSFIKRWYRADKGMDSMHFVYIQVEKEK